MLCLEFFHPLSGSAELSDSTNVSPLPAGVTIAVAIAIHNIPEGIIVAIPIYYATHNRSFAILMSGISAITEPIGALVGLAVACTGSINDVALGVVFGLIAGIMVYIR